MQANAPIQWAFYDKPWVPRLLRLVALFLVISGIALFAGGIKLLMTDGVFVLGSLYYPVGGLLLVLSGLLLWKRQSKAITLYWIFLILTLVWTIFEVRFRIWGWVPRLSLWVILGLVMSLARGWTLPRPASRLAISVPLAANLIVIAGCGVAIFSPQDTTFLRPEEVSTKPLVADSQAEARAGQPNEDWRAYGRDKDATRFSPLAQITPENVGKLEKVWEYRTGDLPPKGKKNKWAAETTPIKVGNAVYLCTATNDMIKLNAATGKEVWRFKAETKYESVPYTAACRGVTHYVSKVVPKGQECHEKIIEGTLDMRLIAVDADTGKVCSGFGDKGQVSLLKGMGHTVPGWLAVTSPPVVVNNTVVVNHQVLDGQRRWAPSGVIRGYDVETGAFRWAWDVNRPGITTEPGPGEEYSRGTPNSWAAMAGDDELGLVYVPMGNSAVDYYSALRTENENRVASAVVALDAATGAERWVFQTVYKDVWDYDLGSQPTLFEYPGPDKTVVKGMILPTKRGQTFVLNRETGKPLTKVEDRPAPMGNVPGDPRAPTQPWSVDMPRLGFPDLTEEQMWGMSPFDQLACRIKFKKAHYVGEFTPPVIGKPWIEYPGYNGGSDWGSMAYNPQTGVLIANWNNTPMYDELIPRDKADKLGMYPIDSPKFDGSKSGAEGAGAQADTPYAISVSPLMLNFTQMLCNTPPYGMISAINMHSKEVIWQRPLGTGRANGPFGLPTYMPVNIGTPNNGGPVVTAGGLVFVAAATDNLLRAIDIKTGKDVWSVVLPAGGQATPMTYSVGGKQYLVMMSGGHHFMGTPVGDYVTAWALPDH